MYRFKSVQPVSLSVHLSWAEQKYVIYKRMFDKFFNVVHDTSQK